MFRPMPSPRGTNHERLFVRDRNPEGAYDAAITADQFTKIMKLLADAGVSTTILAEVEHMMTHENAGLGMDARPRRAPGHSENERAFLRRFPDAGRIGQAW